MKCQQCDNPLIEGDTFCGHCGAKQNEPSFGYPDSPFPPPPMQPPPPRPDQFPKPPSANSEKNQPIEQAINGMRHVSAAGASVHFLIGIAISVISIAVFFYGLSGGFHEAYRFVHSNEFAAGYWQETDGDNWLLLTKWENPDSSAPTLGMRFLQPDAKTLILNSIAQPRDPSESTGERKPLAYADTSGDINAFTLFAEEVKSGELRIWADWGNNNDALERYEICVGTYRFVPDKEPPK